MKGGAHDLSTQFCSHDFCGCGDDCLRSAEILLAPDWVQLGAVYQLNRDFNCRKRTRRISVAIVSIQSQPRWETGGVCRAKIARLCSVNQTRQRSSYLWMGN